MSGQSDSELRRAARLFTKAPGAFVGICLALVPLGVLGLTCVFGLVLLPWAYGKLVSAFLEATGRPAARSAFGPGVFVALGALPLFVALLGAGGAVSALDSNAVVLGVLVPPFVGAVVGVALAPWLFAPFAAAEEGGVIAPLLRSFELSARVGLARTLRLGASLGALAAAGQSALALAGYRPDLEQVIALGAIVVAILVPPIAGSLVAVRYAELGRERRPAAPATSAMLRTLIGLSAPLAIVTLALLAIAALTPAPMRALPARDAVARGMHRPGLVTDPPEQLLPGTSVTVRVVPEGLSIEAEDGGGAGLVRSGFETDVSLLMVEPRDEGFRLVLTNGDRWGETFVDLDGVRLDDGLDRRVGARLGRVGGSALALACVLFLVFMLVLAVQTSRAEGLEAPSLLGAGRQGAGPWALVGKLRRRDASKLSIARRAFGRAMIELDGDAWVEADEFRVRLPGRAPLLGGGDLDVDAASAVVVSRFAGLSPAGLRDAFAEWPLDGVLVLGQLEDARRRLAERATRVASRFALLGATSLLVTIVVLIGSLAG